MNNLNEITNGPCYNDSIKYSPKYLPNTVNNLIPAIEHSTKYDTTNYILFNTTCISNVSI